MIDFEENKKQLQEMKNKIQNIRRFSLTYLN